VCVVFVWDDVQSVFMTVWGSGGMGLFFNMFVTCTRTIIKKKTTKY
jgi:hypothetical protein